jgi:hypothetical protein
MSTYNPEAYRKWYADNREHKLAYGRAYYMANADRFAEQHAVYYKEKGTVVRAQQNARNAKLRAEGLKYRFNPATGKYCWIKPEVLAEINKTINQ